MIHLGCESKKLKCIVIKLRNTEGQAMIERHLSRQEKKGGKRNLPLCCCNSPLGWRGILRGLI